MRVRVMSCTPDPIGVISRAAGTCYGKPNVSKNRVRRCLESGHMSVFEHASATFDVAGISRACYDEETEILTRDGWKSFSDVNVGDDVLTLNQTNGKAEFQQVEDTIQYEYSGKMYHYHSQSVDALVTPNHNMWIKKYDVRVPSDYFLARADEIKVKRFRFEKLMHYNGAVDESFAIPGVVYARKNRNGDEYTKEISARCVNRKSFMRLLAWYLAEGSSYLSKQNGTWRFSISQLKNDYYEDIESAITECGFCATKSMLNGKCRGFKFSSFQLGNFLDKCGHSADKKCLPFDVFEEFDSETAKVFVDEYIKADGTIDANGCKKIFTCSKQLANEIYTLCYMAGYTAMLKEDTSRVGTYHKSPTGDMIRFNHPSFVLYVSTDKAVRNISPVIKSDSNISFEKYDGTVFCVTVPNHVIFVRRNGKAMWCGNCSHQLVRHRLASYSQKSQRYCKVDTDSEDWYVVPPTFEKRHPCRFGAAMREAASVYNLALESGYRPEDARYLLPEACKTAIVVSMNARELFHFLDVRGTQQAQWEIRELARAMADALRGVDGWRELIEMREES